MSNPLRDLAKAAVYGGYARLLRPLPRAALSLTGRQRLVILLYHRVSDDFRDSVTIGCEHFEAQMAHIARYYPLLSLDDLIAGNFDRHAHRPLIAVTFDDGYLDNYTNAVPILRRHRVPAGFFVSTGIVGTDRGFAHDLKKLGHALPNMSWEQIGEMKEMGFFIGAHTVNHANLAKIDDETARYELTESMNTLRQRLGLQEVAIAYPFGKRSDITEERRRLIRELGYAACFSAYGGRNRFPLDLFDIRRSGVNFAYTRTAFEALIEGWV